MSFVLVHLLNEGPLGRKAAERQARLFPPVADGSADARRRDVGGRVRLRGHRRHPREFQEGRLAYADGLRTTTRTRWTALLQNPS